MTDTTVVVRDASGSHLIPLRVSDNGDGTYSLASRSEVSGSLFATVLTSNTTTRPADTTAYASGDLVANSTSSGSVVPFSFASAASIEAGVGRIDRIQLVKSGTSTTNASFRVHLFTILPVPTVGDNAAIASPVTGYVGAFDVTVDRAWTGGAVGVGVPLYGSAAMFKLAAGTTLYALLEARAAYTPGNAETFTLLAETYRF